MLAEFVTFNDDGLLLRFKRLEYLNILRLRLRKDGWNVIARADYSYPLRSYGIITSYS